MKFHRVTCENNLFKYLKLKLEFEKRKEKINRFEMNLYFSLPSSEEVSFVLRNYFLVSRTLDFYHENNRIKIDEEIILRKDSERKRLRIFFLSYNSLNYR